MKKSKKIIILAISIVFVIGTVAVAAGAVLQNDLAKDIIESIVKGETDLDTQDLNDDNKVDILDVILAVKLDGPLLATLELDDKSYGTIDFEKSTFTYTVNLPAGRPRIPKLIATAEDGLTIDYQQATISDTESEGIAKATVSTGSKSNTYMVKFIRAAVAEEKATIELQYDDRWTFKPAGAVSFTSSDESLATVDTDGVIHAKAVTGEEIKITAKDANGSEIDTLTISKIHKATINLFFVTGQSNSQGCYDYTYSDLNGDGEINTLEKNKQKAEQALEQLEKVDQPIRKGQVYSFDVYPYLADNDFIDKNLVASGSTWYDMKDYKRSGFASALGKKYYELSGEKVIFLQTGYDGSPIERWLDPTKDDLAETYFNHYTATFKAYQKLTETKILGENNDKYLTELYEINHRANFWLQGESCMSLSWKYWTATGNPYGYMNPTAAGRDLLTDEDYANMFLKVHANMKNDFGIETNNILLVRATQGVSSSENRELQLLTDINEIRAAQYYLGNNNPEIAIVSRISDIARMYTSNDKTSEGYGYMGVGNVHYNQIGHNANGVAAATNYFKALDADTNSSVRSVEIIDTNGRTRLGSDKVFEMEVNQTKRLAAMALPEYSRSDVKWESSNVNVATVDQYGLITAVDIGETTITATSDNGKSNSVKVVVYEVREININYRWDFNDLTETNGNNLSLSDLASATGNNYTIDKENGIYSTTSNLSDGERPDFTVEKPFTFDSEHNWSIEWRYFAKEGRAATLMGQTPIAENTSTLAGYIYLLYTTKWSESAGYPLRFVPQEGNVISLNYGDKRDLNTSMNTWRLSYDVSTKTMTLKVSVDNGITWDDVSSAKTGTFKTTITNLFGRQNAKGSGNFTGSVDYIDVKTVETVRVTEETN